MYIFQIPAGHFRKCVNLRWLLFPDQRDELQPFGGQEISCGFHAREKHTLSSGRGFAGSERLEGSLKVIENVFHTLHADFECLHPRSPFITRSTSASKSNRNRGTSRNS